MSHITITKIDESFVKINYDSPSVGQNISDYFSFFADGYRFSPKFKYSGWDGKVRLFNRTSGLLPLGLLSMMGRFLSEYGYTSNDYGTFIEPKIEFTEDELTKYAEDFRAWSGDSMIEPYWYQKESFFNAFKKGRLLINLPTGAGKSLAQAMISRFYIDRVRDDQSFVLIIVPTVSLVSQMGDDFRDYRTFERSDIQYIMGGEDRTIHPSTKVVISTWQSAIKLDREWFNRVGLLMVDECHLAEGKSIQTICLERARNAHWRFGLTGTVKDGKSSILMLRSIFGEIYRPVTTSDLIDQGMISNISINVIQLGYPEEIRERFKQLKTPYQTEISFVTEYPKRNAFISSLARRLVSKGDNALVLFNYQKHGEELYRLVKEAGHSNVLLVYGKSDKELRESMRGIIESGEGYILIASYGVLSTGVSIKRLHHVVFAHPLKSKVKVLQSIGRGLRTHVEKEKMLLWDIVDDISVETKRKNAKNKYSFMNYGLKHFVERARLYIEDKFNYSIKKWDL